MKQLSLHWELCLSVQFSISEFSDFTFLQCQLTDSYPARLSRERPRESNRFGCQLTHSGIGAISIGSNSTHHTHRNTLAPSLTHSRVTCHTLLATLMASSPHSRPASPHSSKQGEAAGVGQLRGLYEPFGHRSHLGIGTVWDYQVVSVEPRGAGRQRESTKWLQERGHGSNIISEAPRSALLSLAPVSAKELKERALQGVL